MSEQRWKESKERIEHIINLVKEASDDQITLINSSKNLSFMSRHTLNNSRWKKYLRTLTIDEYDESMRNIYKYPEVLHVFFIERLFSNVIMKKPERLKIYVKIGVDVEENIIVVSFHEPDFPLDRRFERE